MRETDWQDRKGANDPRDVGAGAYEQEFEQALRRALRRVDAPEGFAARVAALAAAERRTSQAASSTAAERVAWWRLPLGWKPAWGGLAALLVAGVLSGPVVHERRGQERARAEASREFDQSVRITERALDHAREQLRRAGIPLDGDGQ